MATPRPKSADIEPSEPPDPPASTPLIAADAGGSPRRRKIMAPPPAATSASAALWFPALMTCSVGMVLLNKTLSVGFPYPNSVLGLQNGASVVYLIAGSRAGVFDVLPFRREQFRQFLWPTVNWVFMLALSLKMLQYNSVATMVMFRTVGTLATCAVEQVVFGARYTLRAQCALGVLAAGTLIYAHADVGFSAVGYAWATLQMCSWVLQAFVEKIAIVESDQTKTGVTVIRNVLSLPVVVVLIIGTGEGGALPALATRREVWGQVALSSLLGCGLGLSTSALYKTFAPTAVVVANNVGKCISIVAGSILFEEVLGTAQVFGLALSLAGSFWFGQEERKRQEENVEEKKVAGEHSV